MMYEWLKAMHVAAVVTWVGGMLVVALTLSAAATFPGSAGLVTAVRRWDRMVTSPAMLLVWALGITLATQGGWFTETWLQVKLAIVIALSALHGMLSGRLRRLSGQRPADPSPYRYAPPAILLAASAIIVLVIIKPF